MVASCPQSSLRPAQPSGTWAYVARTRSPTVILSANRRATLCAHRLSLVGRRSNVAAAAACPHPKTAAKSTVEASASPAQPPPLQSRQTRADDRAARDTAGDHAEIGPSLPSGCPAAPTRSASLRRADRRTRTPDARTPDARTPDADRRRRQGIHSDILESHNHEDGRRYGEPLLWGERLRFANQ
jgi:hypothetical protein